VTNTPTTSKPTTGIRLSQATLIFIVLVSALGALLMAATSINPAAFVRAQNTPTNPASAAAVSQPDAFADTEYITFTSPDRAIQVNHPKSWQAIASQQFSPVQYSISPVGSQTTAILILALPIRTLAGGDSAIANDAELVDVIRLFISDEDTSNFTGTTLAGKSGLAIHEQFTDPNTRIVFERELRIAKINSETIIALQAVTLPADWEKMRPYLEQAAASLTFDEKAIMNALNQAFPAPTPIPTAAPTAIPTNEATPDATAEPTESAPAPTDSPTAAPTQSN